MTRPAERAGTLAAWYGVAACVSLCLHLRAVYAGPAWQVYAFKPLTTVLVFTAAVAAARAHPCESARRYRAAVFLGLAWSLAGDVLLMLPGDWFVGGLSCFLVAHLCYIAAFASDGGLRLGGRQALAAAGVLAGLLAALRPPPGPLRLPVVAYGVVIVTMAWQAAERWNARRSAGALRAAVGAALFLVSDATLAYDRFVAAVPAAAVLVMTTYVAAQWLIATSVIDAGRDPGQPALSALPGRP